MSTFEAGPISGLILRRLHAIAHLAVGRTRDLAVTTVDGRGVWPRSKGAPAHSAHSADENASTSFRIYKHTSTRADARAVGRTRTCALVDRVIANWLRI